MVKVKKGESTFEKDLERLEAIVADLEEGGLALDDAIKRFEEGVGLYRQCEKTLKAAERKIEMLVRAADGALETVPFDEEEKEDAAGPAEAPAVSAGGYVAEDEEPGEPEEPGDEDGMLF